MADTADLSAVPVRHRTRRRGRPRWLTLPVMLGIAIIVFWFVVALTIPLWAPYDPVSIAGRRLQPPSTTENT